MSKMTSGHFYDKQTVEKRYIPFPKWRYTTIIPAVLFYKVCLELIFQSTTQYIYHRLKEQNVTGNFSTNATTKMPSTSCNTTSGHGEPDKVVQEESAQWQLYFSLAAYGIGVVSSLLLGSLSDNVGRKLLFYSPLVGAVGQALVSTSVIYFHWDISFLVIASVMNGIGGTHYAHNLGCYCYIADLTSPGKARSFGLGVMDINISVGLALANIGVGYLIEYLGYLVPCWAALGSLCISITITIFCVPETLKEKKQFNFESMFRNIRENFKSFRDVQKNNRFQFWILTACYAIYLFPEVAGAGITTLYQLNFPFCWNSEMIGWYYAANFVISQVIGVLLIKVIHLCMEDESMALIGCISMMAADVVTALAVNTLMLYLASVSGIVSSVSLPAIRGMLSRMVSDRNQGSLFATLTSLEVLCRFASSTSLSSIYGHSQDFMPGLVYLVKAGFTFVTFCLLWVLFIVKRRRETRITNVN